MTVILRFVFGVVLAGSLLWWIGIPLIASIIFVLLVGIIAAVWGDRFLMAFMSAMRYLR